MGEVIEKMKSRRSIRRYKPDMVPKKMIEEVAEAGIWAPSARNRQTSIVIAVTDPEVRNRLSKTNAEIAGSTGDPFYGAPVVLAVLGNMEGPNHIYDGSLTMGNMLLAAHELGLGACWIHLAKQTFEMPEWKAWVKSQGIEGEYEGIGFCILGYPDGDYPAEIPRKENRVFFVEQAPPALGMEQKES